MIDHLDLRPPAPVAAPDLPDLGFHGSRVFAPVGRIGAALQRNGAFPDSVNVGFVERMARDRIRLRVYERGAGETLDRRGAGRGRGPYSAASAL